MSKKKKKKKLDPAEVLNTCFSGKTYTRTRSIQKMEPYKISPGPLTLYSRKISQSFGHVSCADPEIFPDGGGGPKDNFAFRGEVAPMPIYGTF